MFVLYWLLVFPFNPKAASALSVFTHGVNFVVMLLDGWLSRQPYLISHGVYFLAYCLVYLAWSVIHGLSNIKTADGDEYIYAVLNWRSSKGKAAMYATAVLVIVAPLANLFFWWLLHYQRRHLDDPEDSPQREWPAQGRYLNEQQNDRAIASNSGRVPVRGAAVELAAMSPLPQSSHMGRGTGQA